VNEVGGTVRVELNHVDTSSLPSAFSSSENDHRVLAVGRNLADKGLDVTLVSKDLPLRLKASVAGLGAEEYRNELADGDDGWSGIVEVDVDSEVVDSLYRDSVCSTCASPTTCRSTPAWCCDHRPGPPWPGCTRRRAHLVDGDRHLFDVRGRSAEQRIALDLLGDDGVGIVSLGGPAGTGKSVLALAAGLDAVLERGAQRRSSSSGRSTRSAARTSGSCPATRTRR
jgi:PhoH-like ATPase